MPYSDYLKNRYGNVIVTRSGLLSNDRDLVARFTGAALKGLQYTLDHPDEAAAILHSAEPTAAMPAAVGEIQAMKQFSTPVGKLDQQRVTEGIGELEAAALMPTGLTPAQVADFSLA
jgi:NitT/TauT family transport system substrate-binding protein